MKKLTIRLSDKLHSRLVELAQADHRSINKQVIVLIERAIYGHTAHDTAHGAPDKKTSKPS